MIYVLSTTVIQGIVPNAELADSTGPFGLAYEYMFNPTVGKIIMALAVIACLGSLLGWQFTLAQTGKSAAEERMFPAFFSKVNRMGAPITGMIVLGVVQTLACLVDHFADAQRAVQRARQPGGRHERHSLRRRAVVARNHDEEGESARRASIASTSSSPWSRWDTASFALYASGMEAVMGGVLVLSIAYIVWGFIAPRFATAPAGAADRPGKV